MRIRLIRFAPFLESLETRRGEIELEDKSTVLDLLNSVYDSVESRKRLFDEFEKLQAYVSILKNGRPIKTLGGLETELKDGDEVAILPSIAGG